MSVRAILIGLSCSGALVCASAALAAPPTSAEADAAQAPSKEPERPSSEPEPNSRDDASAAKPKPQANEARGYARKPGTEPEDVALAVPRVVLAVPRYALQLVFFPVRAGIELADRYALVEEVTDILYNDERNAAILPTLSIDSFFGPTIGVKAFHEDLAGHGEYASASARFGGIYNLATQLHFRADNFGGSRLWLESTSRFESEPALLFQGIGDGARQLGGTGLGPRDAQIATRFSQQRLLNLARAGYSLGRPGELLQVGGTASHSVGSFGAKQKGEEPSIEQVYDTERLVGFDDRVPVLETDLNLVIDLRDVAGATSSGGYVELFAGKALELGRFGFWHHGAELTGYIDLYRRTRVLVLRAMVEGVDGPDLDIPFSELPRLGGPNRLRGYPLGRFRDEKVALGTIEYHYPVHQLIAGSLYLDVGHVGKSYGDMLDERWKAGFGAGLIVRSRDHQLFTFDVAYGEGVQLHLTTDPLRAFSKRDTEL
jgi:Omp85 superfamily domain